MSGLNRIEFRRGTLADADFVSRAIVEAERSGTTSTLYERLFDLGSSEVLALIKAILHEELTGSELSCDPFILALADGECVGGLAAWVEAVGAPASHIIRANALSYVLGSERWLKARPRLAQLAKVEIEREQGALQIEAVFVDPKWRGRGITAAMIAHAISARTIESPSVKKAQILSTVDNTASAKAFTRAGFVATRRTLSPDAAVRELIPGGRVLWEKPVA